MIRIFENLEGVKVQVESATVTYIEPIDDKSTVLVLGEGRVRLTVKGDAESVGKALGPGEGAGEPPKA